MASSDPGNPAPSAPPPAPPGEAEPPEPTRSSKGTSRSKYTWCPSARLGSISSTLLKSTVVAGTPPASPAETMPYLPETPGEGVTSDEWFMRTQT